MAVISTDRGTGMGTDKQLKGSNVLLMWAQLPHVKLDFNCPKKMSVMMLRWGHTSRDTWQPPVTVARLHIAGRTFEINEIN